MSLAASMGCAAPAGDDVVVQVQGKVVYGTDDRKDPFAYADQAWAARALEFTAALVPTSQINATDPNNITIGNRTLAERLNVCPDERFASQPANADCSATLIAPDIMLTAGHCINNCADSRFVFDYYVTANGALPAITQDDVYACSTFLAYFQSSTGLDYAIVRLTRPVVGRQPAAVRTARTALPAGTPLIVSGYPSGLPLKIADNAAVRSNSPNLDWFVANTDTFVGNSGSGVFDANTKQLVGILVRGAQDYVAAGTCNRVNVCPSDGCRGEDVIYAYRAIDDMCEETSSSLCPTPAVTATFNVSSQSATQYCGDILVRNDTSAVISSWRVDVDLRQSSLLNNWNSVFTSQGGSRYAVTPQPWNRFIQPGQTVAGGMCASKTGPSFLPQILSASGS
jgi:V8-like Glu-specific endopeptidase